MTITKAEADALIAEPKVISANISWRVEQRWQRLEDVAVLAESGEILRLTGKVGRYNHRNDGQAMFETLLLRAATGD